MPRKARNAPGGLIYHVLNRAVGRTHLFGKEVDYEAFERILIEAHQRHPIRILSYCVLSKHWQFVVWPEHDGQLTAFFRWLAHTHAMRWKVVHRHVGSGPVYQGRFKSFPVQDDDHLLTLLRYVEWNPLGAGLVTRAETWPWSSLWARRRGAAALKAILSPWPVPRPADWSRRVYTPVGGLVLWRLGVSLE
jgi:putative transposase